MRAFTLAEALITLGIIGVVAAMTIPNLINNYQKRSIETTLKETYSILQQTMKFTEYDDVALEDFPDSPTGVKEWFEKYLQPHLKYSNVCISKAGCWHKSGSTKTLNKKVAVADYKELGLGAGNLTIKLYNGSNICIDGISSAYFRSVLGNVTDASLAIYIDANGDRPPNIIGKDIYVMAYTTSKGIVPAGYGLAPEEIDKNCSASANQENAGYYCLQKVKNNGWEIPNNVWKIK